MDVKPEISSFEPNGLGIEERKALRLPFDHPDTIATTDLAKCSIGALNQLSMERHAGADHLHQLGILQAIIGDVRKVRAELIDPS